MGQAASKAVIRNSRDLPPGDHIPRAAALGVKKTNFPFPNHVTLPAGRGSQ